MLASPLSLGLVVMLFSQPRLAERALADIAVIKVPRSVKAMFKEPRENQAGRLVFAFSDDYFWASFGSGMAYKQQLFVSVMAPDATEHEYSLYPWHYDLVYDEKKTVRTMAIGSGTLTVVEGFYMRNALREPSHTFLYADRARRLHIAWHAVKKEIDLETGTKVVARMAESFRIRRDPVQLFAEMRERPRKEAEERARKRALALATLAQAGYAPLEPGKPVLRNDVYAEWTTDPEPRFQLLLPLGRVRSTPNAREIDRPRPVILRNADGTRRSLVGAVGWREFADDKWIFSNDESEYLPFPGIANILSERSDSMFTTFYYSATIRVEEADTRDEWLGDLRWFFDSVPEVRRLWQEGKLVTGGKPQPDQ